MDLVLATCSLVHTWTYIEHAAATVAWIRIEHAAATAAWIHIEHAAATTMQPMQPLQSHGNIPDGGYATLRSCKCLNDA